MYQFNQEDPTRIELAYHCDNPLEINSIEKGLNFSEVFTKYNIRQLTDEERKIVFNNKDERFLDKYSISINLLKLSFKDYKDQLMQDTQA